MVLNDKAQDYGISEACIRRVRHAALAANYTPNHHATSMRLGRSMTIGMALNLAGYRQGRHPIPLCQNFFYTSVIFGAEGGVHEVGYDFLLIGPGEDLRAPHRGLDALQRRQIDALILSSEPPDNTVFAPSMPVVFVSSAGPPEVPLVVFDHASAADQIAAHLAELGHRHALWLGPIDQADRELLVFRAASSAGVRLVSGAYPLPTRMEVGSEGYEEYCAARACEMMEQRLTRERDFTAVVAYSDDVALGACKALRRAGLRVPEDISVVGWDNAPSAWMCDPALTTIDHAFGEMGYHAGKLACELAEGGDEAAERLRGHRTVVPSHLLVRESTGPVPS